MSRDPAPCAHASRTLDGCPVCDLKEQLRTRSAIGNGVDCTFTLCPYCKLLVRVVGDPPTVHHELPECARYLGETIEAYYAKLHARIREAC